LEAAYSVLQAFCFTIGLRIAKKNHPPIHVNIQQQATIAQKQVYCFNGTVARREHHNRMQARELYACSTVI
jgi:hypothetical protein